jgi:periplasmic protein TonB
MDTNLVLNAGFNELVFENRHKDYGAYQIRRRYRRNVILSALVASALFLFAFAAYFATLPTANAFVPKPDGPVVVTTTVTLDHDKPKPEEPKEKPKPIVKMPPARGADPNTVPEVTKQQVVTKLNNDSAVGNPKGVEGGSGITKDTTGTPCTNCVTKVDSIPVIPPIIDIASDPPTFPGIDAFFAKNIKYPQIAKEAGIEGTVWLSWVVNTDGTVQDVEVIKGAHPALDREALNVAKKMPAWTPGKDNGKPIRFRYRKPIRFELRK